MSPTLAGKTLMRGPLFLAASIDYAKINEDTREVPVRWKTSTVFTELGWIGGDLVEYEQELPLTAEACDLSVLNAGAAVLNSHGRPIYRNGAVPLDDQFGVVVEGSARIVSSDEAVCVVRIMRSANPDDACERYWQGIVQKIYKNISFGADLVENVDVTIPGASRPRLRATKWRPFEITFTPIQRDYRAVTLASAESERKPCPVLGNPGDPNPMKFRSTPFRAPEDPDQPSGGGTPSATPTPTTPVVTAARPATPTPTPAVTPAADPAAVQRAADEAHERVVGIQQVCNSLRLPADFADGLVRNRTVTLHSAREAAINERARLDQLGNAPGSSGSSVTEVTDRGNARAAITHALLERGGYFASGQHADQLPSQAIRDQSRVYRGMTLMEIGREICNRQRIDVLGQPRDRVAFLSMHGTSDYPAIMLDVANKFLRMGYAPKRQTWREIAKQKNVTDFRDQNIIALGDAPDLDLVPEGAEIPFGTIGEGKEKWKVAKYAKRYAVTLEAIMNDNASAFTELPAKFAARVALKESDLMWSLIKGNPTLSDGIAAFHASHGNLGDKVLSEAGLDQLTTLAAKQTSIDGTPINVTLRHLRVPPELLMTAKKLVALVSPNQTSQVNTFVGTFDTVMSEPRLTSAIEWYAFADPSEQDGLFYSYLDGAEGPKIESKEGWEVPGMEIKCMLIFGAGFGDFRGDYKSTGTV